MAETYQSRIRAWNKYQQQSVGPVGLTLAVLFGGAVAFSAGYLAGDHEAIHSGRKTSMVDDARASFVNVVGSGAAALTQPHPGMGTRTSPPASFPIF